MAKQTPVKKIRVGSISCALWKNEINVNGTTKTLLRATLDRRYKDPKTGEWKSSGSFSRSDIPLCVFVLQKAFEVMVGEQGANGDSNNEVEEEVIM